MEFGYFWYIIYLLEPSMISTVTTSTVTTLTNVALAGTLGLITIVVLVILMIQKEVTSTVRDRRTERLSGALNIALVPLVIVFVAIVLTKIWVVFQ